MPTPNLDNSIALAREVWHHADPATKKALATKLSEQMFRMLENDDHVLRQTVSEIVRVEVSKVVVPEDVRTSLHTRACELLRGAMESEARRVVEEVVRTAANDLSTRFRRMGQDF